MAIRSLLNTASVCTALGVGLPWVDDNGTVKGISDFGEPAAWLAMCTVALLTGAEAWRLHRTGACSMHHMRMSVWAMMVAAAFSVATLGSAWTMAISPNFVVQAGLVCHVLGLILLVAVTISAQQHVAAAALLPDADAVEIPLMDLTVPTDKQQ